MAFIFDTPFPERRRALQGLTAERRQRQSRGAREIAAQGNPVAAGQRHSGEPVQLPSLHPPSIEAIGDLAASPPRMPSTLSRPAHQPDRNEPSMSATADYAPMMRKPQKTGRKSTFTPELAQRICDHIARGGYATDTQRFGLPHVSTINKWLNENEAFAAMYARAREARAETFAEQIIEIADTEEDPARARVRVEARKWVASKLFPRMYGENQRVEVEHTISETAARVLQDLSQRAKQRQELQAPMIDVTPQSVGPSVGLADSATDDSE